MHIFRTARRALYVFGIGAGTAYFLDPETGAERRARVLERVQPFLDSRNSDRHGADQHDIQQHDTGQRDDAVPADQTADTNLVDRTQFAPAGEADVPSYSGAVMADLGSTPAP